MINEYRRKREDQQYLDPIVNENQFKIVETSNLTSSLGGIDVPLIKITDFAHSRE